MLTATGAGVLAGAAAGALGGVLSDAARYALGTVLGAIAVVGGVAILSGRGRPLLQCDRETPKTWVERGPVVWPLLNGAALGFGATSRLGFWLWYSIPVGCFLMARLDAGAVIWGAYGFARAASAGVIWYTQTLYPNRDPAQFLAQRNVANTVTAVLLIILGAAAFLLMGL